jgi:PAS domain S-box-containing protein
MDMVELEHQIEIARDRMATLQHRANESPRSERADVLLDALQALHASFGELDATMTELRRQNAELAATHHALALEQERYRNLFHFAPVGYVVTTLDGTIREANHMAARLFNSPEEQLRGKSLGSFIDAKARSAFRDLLVRPLESDRPYEWSVRLHPRQSIPFDAAAILSAVHDVHGEPVALRWVLSDVTAKRKAEEQLALLNSELERRVLRRTVQLEAASRFKDELLQREAATRRAAEAAQERLAFLAAASSLLNRSLDPTTTLRHVAHLALPLLGDWCIIDLLEDDGSVNRVAVAHTDPAQDALAHDLAELPSAARALTSDESGPTLHSGQSDLVTEPDDDRRLRRSFPDERMQQLIRATRPTSWMRVPLIVRGITRGLVTLIASEDARRYKAEDLSLAEDLASRMAVAVEQARLYQQAQEASQAKSSFLATISHELRTPLNAIIGYAELLLLGIPEAVPSEAAKQVGRIRAASRHLLSLIEELLSFSRIEAGSECIYVEELNAPDLARDAAALVEPLAAAKGLAFHVDVPAALPVLESDPGKVRQILVNLLSNAVKFTQQGEVALSAYSEGGRVAFVVRDTGVGIPREYQERVFEAFWQVRYPTMYHTGGTGLGLSVSRQLARMLGGDLSVESEAGRGSTFTVWLPVRERKTREREGAEYQPRPATELTSPGDTRPSA